MPSAMLRARPGGALVVWDFDWSLIDENSDTFVLEQLDDRGCIWKAAEKRLSSGMGWLELMDWCLGEVHAAGHTAPTIRETLARVPIKEGAVAAVEAASARGAEQHILSDANSVYIESILERRLPAGDFREVVTNPAACDDDGRLRVRPHQPAGTAHGCPLCPPNLCKGAVLQRWLVEMAPSRCVYVGDGGGDYCPATRLRKGDVVLARRAPHDSLLRKCRAKKVAATVVEWGGEADRDGAELVLGMERALDAADDAKLSQLPRVQSDPPSASPASSSTSAILPTSANTATTGVETTPGDD